MRALIAVPFADSRAADLSLAYGLDRLPALGTHHVQRPGGRLELRVLGASHQVVLEAGPDSAARWSETVACLPDRGGPLPAREDVVLDGLTARFEARCLQLTPDALAARVQALRDRYEQHPHALVGTFPGSPLAVTAVLVDPRATGWRSWHAYPQTGELVETRSALGTA